jgi:hypothetical protein
LGWALDQRPQAISSVLGIGLRLVVDSRVLTHELAAAVLQQVDFVPVRRPVRLAALFEREPRR